jgi:hypothetical protein
MSTTTIFELRDVDLEANDTIKVKCTIKGDGGLSISLDNHSTKASVDGFDDAPVYIEFNDGKVILYVWSDINNEDPTHKIDLSGALTSRRSTIFRGNLYFIGDDGIKCHLAAFEESAMTSQELEQKVLAKLWDQRLDSAGCTPYFEYAIKDYF